MNSQETPAKLLNNYMLVPHQEQVYVHVNSSFVFVGEYLYYTIYCLKDNTGELSDVSKIAYLKLVNQDREVVLNHKIKLLNGMGDGNFFVPSSIPSGNYKLIAYTQWMLNNGREYFYNEDITILNPFTSDQTIFRNEIKDESVFYKSESKSPENNFSENMPLQLELDKYSYATRESILVKIASRGLEGLGNYSISVRKVDELETKVKTTAVEYKKNYPNKSSIEGLILPEQRGELLTGELTFSKVDVNPENRVLAVSFPGEDYLFKIATTNAKGYFFVNVGEDYNAEEVYIQGLSKEDENYKIELKPEEVLNLVDLKFQTFKLEGNSGPLIKERSIYNQIENAYYSSKPDTILIGKPNEKFYGKGTIKFVLDEYTRFPSIKETFLEVIEHVWIEQNKDGKQEFHVRPIAPYIESGKLPLVFVDGILILDHERLINLSAAQVKSVNISRNQHFYGTTTFQGVVDVTTFNSDFYKNYYANNMLSMKLFKPIESKNYFQQSYKGELKEKNKRLPDFRYQLLWLPKFKMSKKEESFEVYSSDIQGEFEISLEGFTTSGLPISLKKNFFIK